MSSTLSQVLLSRLSHCYQVTHLTRPLTFCYLINQKRANSVRNNSSIFISDRIPKVSRNFQFDHNLSERLADTEALKHNLNLRGSDVNVDVLLKEYEEFCVLEEEKFRLEAQKAEVAKQMAWIVKVETEQIICKESTEIKKELMTEGKKTKQELKQLMPRFWDLEERVMKQALALPNDTLSTVSVKGEIIEEYFQDQKAMSSHPSFQEVSNDIKYSNVGQHAYYLKGRLAVLEQELIRRFSAELRDLGLTQILAPEMFKAPVMEAGALNLEDADAVYRLHSKPVQSELEPDWNPDNIYLRGSPHLSFLAYLAKMKINVEDLPQQLFTVGRNYTPVLTTNCEFLGLLGASQSTKFGVCGVSSTLDSCLDVLKEFTDHLSKLYQGFNITFRLVSVPVPSLSASEMSRIELQMWIPSLQRDVTMASLSVCGDYSSRRLMIRCSPGDQRDTSPVHMVFGEVADISRLIHVLMEYGQTRTHWGPHRTQTESS